MLMVARWGVVGGISEKGEEIKYKLIVTKQSQGCKIQHRKQSSQRTHMHDPWTWTMVEDCLRELQGEAGWREAKVEKLGQL